jgi:hypothetical protein
MRAFPGAELHPLDMKAMRHESYAHVRWQIDNARLEVRRRLSRWMDQRRAAPQAEVNKAQAWFDKKVRRAFAQHQRKEERLRAAFNSAQKRYHANRLPWAELEAHRLRFNDFLATGIETPLEKFLPKKPQDQNAAVMH